MTDVSKALKDFYNNSLFHDYISWSEFKDFTHWLYTMRRISYEEMLYMKEGNLLRLYKAFSDVRLNSMLGCIGSQYGN